METAESVELKPAATLSVAEQLAALRADMDPPLEAAARGGTMKKPCCKSERAWHAASTRAATRYRQAKGCKEGRAQEASSCYEHR